MRRRCCQPSSPSATSAGGLGDQQRAVAGAEGVEHRAGAAQHEPGGEHAGEPGGHEADQRQPAVPRRGQGQRRAPSSVHEQREQTADPDRRRDDVDAEGGDGGEVVLGRRGVPAQHHREDQGRQRHRQQDAGAEHGAPRRGGRHDGDERHRPAGPHARRRCPRRRPGATPGRAPSGRCPAAGSGSGARRARWPPAHASGPRRRGAEGPPRLRGRRPAPPGSSTAARRSVPTVPRAAIRPASVATGSPHSTSRPDAGSPAGSAVGPPSPTASAQNRTAPRPAAVSSAASACRRRDVPATGPADGAPARRDGRRGGAHPRRRSRVTTRAPSPTRTTAPAAGQTGATPSTGRALARCDSRWPRPPAPVTSPAAAVRRPPPSR